MESKLSETLIPFETTQSVSLDFWSLLRKHPREFYLIYLLEFLIEFPFTLVISGSTIYNIDVQKFTELEAGGIFALIGLAVGVCAILFSNYPARYGVKPGLCLGSSLGLATNILMYMLRDRYVQVGIMFLLYIPAISINFISLKLAVKQFTYPETRSFGFSLFYMVFFIAAGLSGVTIDVLLTYYGVNVKPFTYLFVLNAGLYTCALILTYCLRNFDAETQKTHIPIFDMTQSAWDYTKEALSHPNFSRFFSLILLLSIVKSVYFHLNATLPLYMYRDLGEGAHFGYMMAGHQLVLILSTPSLTFLVYHFQSFTLLLIGSFITALSVLVFVFGSNYYTIAAFVSVISFGEAIYSPRLVDYTLEIAPKGKEALYIGIANIPNFLSLLVTGISSGILLHFFCPEDADGECRIMWFWIGGYSLLACFAMLAFKSFFMHRACIKEIG